MEKKKKVIKTEEETEETTKEKEPTAEELDSEDGEILKDTEETA